MAVSAVRCVCLSLEYPNSLVFADPPGRFLRKDEKSGRWIDIGDKKAAEKTSQALREKSIDERDSSVKSDPGTGISAVLLPNPASYLAAATAQAMGNILSTGTTEASEDAKLAGAEEAKDDVAKPEKKSEEEVKADVFETADV
jgi:hypothetical protein